MPKVHAAGRHPNRTPATLEARKVECARVIKMLLLEFGLPDTPKPNLMDEDYWTIFQGCLSCSIAVTNYAETETMEQMVWLYETIVVASSAVHQEFDMEITAAFHGLMKTACLLNQLVDLLRSLHGM